MPHLGCRKWGCNKWGLKGCLAALPGNRPKSAFSALFLPFSPFSGGCKSTWEIQKTEEKGLFPQISSDLLKPPSLKPPFAALQHKRKRKLRCSFRNAALQKLHCNIGFSAVQKSFGQEAALQQTKNCTATSKKLRCRKVALSCRFPAGFKPPRLGTHV